MNRRHGELLFIENDMAVVAEASFALDRLWWRLQLACRKPIMSLDDVDGIGQELRDVEAGLCVARRVLQERRGL